MAPPKRAKPGDDTFISSIIKEEEAERKARKVAQKPRGESPQGEEGGGRGARKIFGRGRSWGRDYSSLERQTEALDAVKVIDGTAIAVCKVAQGR